LSISNSTICPKSYLYLRQTKNPTAINKSLFILFDRELDQMKKIILLLLCLLLVVCTKSDRWPIDKSALSYFSGDYLSCKEQFVKQSSSLSNFYLNSKVDSIRLIANGDSLAIDYLYIPSQSTPRNLVVLSSGTHGIEGYAGSAYQRMFMTEMLKGIDHQSTGYLIIHGINPWGMKNKRRVDQNNVDLNRNYDISTTLFSNKNEGYSKINDFLNPSGRASLHFLTSLSFITQASWIIIKNSMKTARQAILMGQYEHPDGIYYGGEMFEPQKPDIQNLITTTADEYKKILVIDLHTGYGSRGRLHIFGTFSKDSGVVNETERIFCNHRIDWPNDKDFYENNGDFTLFISRVLKDKMVIPVTFEYGTLNSNSLSGSLKSLQIMIMENQGYHFGYSDKQSEKKIRVMFLEAFYPSSLSWRSETVRQTHELIDEAIKNLTQ
jgi:hypothetical protein